MLYSQTVLLVVGGLLVVLKPFAPAGRWWAALALVALIAAGCLLGTTDQGYQAFDAWRGRASETAGVRDTGTAQSLAPVVQWAGLGIGLLFVLSAWDGQRSPDVFGLLLWTTAGVMLVGSVTDLVTMFFALELVSGSAFLLLCLSRAEKAPRDAVWKQGLLCVTSALLLLYGFSLIYGLTGTTRLADIQHVLTAAYAPAPPNVPVGRGSRLGVTAIVLIFGGLGFRLGVMPFQFGTPDVHQGSTAWQAGLLAVAPKAAAFVVLIRLLQNCVIGFESAAQLLALVLSGATMLLCSATALWQTNVRRMLAYAALAHGGFVLMGLASGIWEAAHPEAGLNAGHSLPGGYASALFYLGCYLLSASGLFAVLAYLARPGRQIEFLEELSGLVRSEPWAAGCLFVLTLSLAGLPPLPGFWGELLLLGSTFSVQSESAGAAVPAPHAGFYLLGLVAIVSMILLAAVYLRLVVAMFLDRAAGRPQPAGGQPALAAGVFAAVLLIGVGLLPGPVLGYLQDVTEPPPTIGTLKPSASKAATTAQRDTGTKGQSPNDPPCSFLSPFVP